MSVRWLLSCAVLVLATPVHHASAATAEQQPNILFILIDDMGFGDLSVTGNREVATPNIDQLAGEGLVMTQFYDAAPICSPSRAGFFTGQYPARNRFVSYIGARAINARSRQADWLDTQVPNLARTLRQAGYATGHFGKWHLGGGRDIGEAPLITDYGFDESYTQFGGLGPRVLPLNVDDELMRLAKQSEALGKGPVDWLRRGEITPRFIDKTLDFVMRHKDRPWFAQLWLDDVHAPWVPDAEQAAAVDGKGRDTNERDFLAVLVAMDREIGRLVDRLRVSGELDDTLIILTSDNGPNSVARFYRDGGQPPGSAGIYRGRKDSLYEGGIRQPLILRWPGKIPAGKRDDRTLSHAVDLLPTLASIAGVRAGGKLDGVNLLSAWRGKPITRRPDLFWTYGAYGEYSASPRPTLPVDNSPAFAIRSGAWKLLANGNGGDAELYNIVADPRESRNLITISPTIARRLTARLLAWQRSLPLQPFLANPAQSVASELSPSSSAARGDSPLM